MLKFVCLLAVKRATQHRLFIENLDLRCPRPTSLFKHTNKLLFYLTSVASDELNQRQSHIK